MLPLPNKKDTPPADCSSGRGLAGCLSGTGWHRRGFLSGPGKQRNTTGNQAGWTGCEGLKSGGPSQMTPPYWGDGT